MARQKGHTLYMAVTPDEYEFPIFITPSVDELAQWAGVSVTGLYSMISRTAKKAPYRPKSHSPYRYRKVVILEENWHESNTRTIHHRR